MDYNMLTYYMTHIVTFFFLIEVLICNTYVVGFHLHEFTYYYKVCSQI